MNYPKDNLKELQVIKEITQNAVHTAYVNADDPWKEYAMHCLATVARNMPYFTVADVRPHVEASRYRTHDKRAMGGVIQAARAIGWIEPSGEQRVNKVGHGIKMQVWKSRLYQEK